MALDDPKLDPLQGFDVKVKVQTSASDHTARLVGAFTSLMFKVVNQTETYLPLNSRIPRMLDGEMIVVWSLEQGLVDLSVIKNTFGDNVAIAFAAGRGSLIPRQTRFTIEFSANLASQDIATMASSDATFYQSSENISASKSVYRLDFCRVDTMNFGVTAGRHVVANTWQGTAQHLAVVAKAATTT